MPTLYFMKEKYDVDYAVRGKDYIEGYKNGVVICGFWGVENFEEFRYNAPYRLPKFDVNEMIDFSEERFGETDEALIYLSEGYEKLVDMLEKSLVEIALGGSTTQQSVAMAKQIKKGHLTLQDVPEKYVEEVSMYIRSL